ncbi:MAG TPA: hypothetical protein ENI87_11725 [bacterium]|nr:hypothetical protein [bacterium]
MTVGLVVAVALTGGLIVFGLRGWERMVRNSRRREPDDSRGRSSGARAARPATSPDRPQPFDGAAAWFAVPARDPLAVQKVLGLRTVLPANWAAGLAAARTEGVFVAPPVDGWVLAVGRDVAALAAEVERLEGLLARLSGEFGTACWFCTDDASDVHGWARAERGHLQRGYTYREEHGHTCWIGDLTAEERAIGCFVDDPRDRSDDEIKWWPDRRIVAALAGAWSVDPMRLDRERAPSATGVIGRL